MSIDPRTLFLITRQTLRQMKGGTIAWAVAIAIYTVVNLAVYPTFRDSGMIQNIPQTMIKAFGLQDMLKVGAFLFSKVYATLPLALALYPIMTFASAIAGAEELGTLDILMAQPIRRREYALGTWIAMVLSLFGILLTTTGAAWLAIRVIGEHLGLLTTLHSTLLVLPPIIFFGTLALLLSAKMRNRGVVIGIAFATMFLMYLIDVVGRLAPRLDGLRWISVFRYFGDITTQVIPWWHPLVPLAGTIALLLMVLRVVEQRDIFA